MKVFKNNNILCITRVYTKYNYLKNTKYIRKNRCPWAEMI